MPQHLNYSRAAQNHQKEEASRLGGFSRNKIQLQLYSQSDFLPTTISSLTIRSSINTRLIIMVLGSNVGLTDKSPFSIWIQ